jgi:hypothetical protein
VSAVTESERILAQAIARWPDLRPLNGWEGWEWDSGRDGLEQSDYLIGTRTTEAGWRYGLIVIEPGPQDWPLYAWRYQPDGPAIWERRGTAGMVLPELRKRAYGHQCRPPMENCPYDVGDAWLCPEHCGVVWVVTRVQWRPFKYRTSRDMPISARTWWEPRENPTLDDLYLWLDTRAMYLAIEKGYRNPDGTPTWE